MVDLFQFLDLILPPRDLKSIGEYHTGLDRMHFRFPLFPYALILSISRVPMAVQHLTGIEVLLEELEDTGPLEDCEKHIWRVLQ